MSLSNYYPKRIIILLFYFFIIHGTQAGIQQYPSKPTRQDLPSKEKDKFFEDIFKHGSALDSVLMKNPTWKWEIIYSQVDRGRNGIPVLTNHAFKNDSLSISDEFIPVFLPVSLLTLQKLIEFKDKGIDRNTVMITETGQPGQTPAYNEPQWPDGKPTPARYISKLLLLDDIASYNRLYEFLGKEYIEDAFNEKEYPIKIHARLGMAPDPLRDQYTNPVNFLGAGNSILYQQPMLHNGKEYTNFVESGTETPPAFPNLYWDHNHCSLSSLHQIMTGIIFPEKVRSVQRFNIAPDDRLFILKSISQLPSETIYPYFDATVEDPFSKYLLYDKERLSGSALRLFSTATVTEDHIGLSAFVIDISNGMEFLVSVSLLKISPSPGKSSTFRQDATYFLRNLGNALYNYESGRIKKIKPDLSAFIITYDK